jgi:hypothetical protein
MHQNLQCTFAKASFAVFLLGLLTGCKEMPVPMKDAIGSYEYYSGAKPQGSICFVLNGDGTYRLGNAKDPLSEISLSGSPTNAHWTLASDQKLLIGKSSLPIEHKSSYIQITVNDDLGMYCNLAVRR